MTFQSGQSGNPAGRPKGARGKATIMAEGMLDGEAQDIIRAAIDLAKAGDVAAIRVCLDRIAPRRRDCPVAFELPPFGAANGYTPTDAYSPEIGVHILDILGQDDVTPLGIEEAARVAWDFPECHGSVPRLPAVGFRC